MQITLTVILVVAMAASAHALQFTNTLYNTGAGVAASNLADAHYDIISAPNGVTLGDANVYASNQFPLLSNWLADNSTSKWIGPAGGNGNVAVGSYTYRTTFNIQNGFDLTSLVINGRWMTDNYGSSIKLNGHALALPSLPIGFGATNWANFSITQDFFQTGINTLDFVVDNAAGNSGNPTGLRVEFTSNDGTPVPEPGTVMLLGFGMLGLAVYGKRRMNKS